jgi:hypothetical protein
MGPLQCLAENGAEKRRWDSNFSRGKANIAEDVCNENQTELTSELIYLVIFGNRLR